MAAKITGVFSIREQETPDKEKFRFTAIAFGRIGGQNVGAKLSKETQKKLGKLGYDPEDVIIKLQKELLQGNLTIPDHVTKEFFADGTIN